MAIQEASAALSTEINLVTITGFLFIQSGELSQADGSVKARSSSTWTAAPTWSEFRFTGTLEPIIWTSEIQDLGEIKYFCLDIQTSVAGYVEYYDIFVSDTGLFLGEESQTRVVNGDYDIPAFYGRYYAVQVKVSGTDLYSMQMTANSESKKIEINNIDTSTLTGSITGRVLPINYPISGILGIDVKVRESDSYVMDVYVTDMPNSVVLIPVVVSTDPTSPTIALYGLDNQPRDGLVDVTITALPRMVMFAGNITIIY